jgi:hypothetical protein
LTRVIASRTSTATATVEVRRTVGVLVITLVSLTNKHG